VDRLALCEMAHQFGTHALACGTGSLLVFRQQAV